MKLYEITIKPQSGIGTPLKGDTLFGHFCWQAAYQLELLKGGLEAALKAYATEPFAVFSSAIPKLPGPPVRYILRRPDLPLHMLFRAEGKEDRASNYRELKNHKARKWVIFNGKPPLNLHKAIFWNDQQLSESVYSYLSKNLRRRTEISGDIAFLERFEQPHNTINRLTGTTGKGAFAPYNLQSLYYAAATELAVFVLLNDQWTDIERVMKAMTNIGRFGFGRDASIGMGRFEVIRYDKAPQQLPEKSEGLYTLGPCLPQGKEAAARCRFTPFTRFGRHGDRLAVSRNPFKTPVIMAEEGAIFMPDPGVTYVKPYVGSAVTGVSKVQPAAVLQGYAPYWPIRLEKNDE